MPSLSLSYPCPGNTSLCVYLSRYLSLRVILSVTSHLYSLTPDAYLPHYPTSCLPSLQVHISHLSQCWSHHSFCVNLSSPKVSCRSAAVGTYFTYQRVSQISTNSIIRLNKNSTPASTLAVYTLTQDVQVYSAGPPPKLGPDAKFSKKHRLSGIESVLSLTFLEDILKQVD